MASGWTTTGSLADSLDDVRSAARIVRENEGVMTQLVDKKTLGEGIGLTWQEVTYAALTAQAVTENTELDNPQQLSDTLLTITPTIVGIETFVTDRVKARIFRQGLAQIGKLAQNAIQRKKNEDGLAVLDGATTSLGGAGVVTTHGHVSAGAVRITSNTTERGVPPIYAVLHGFQIKALWDEVTSGLGTYPIPEGMTARAIVDGYKGTISGAKVYEDGDITVDSSDDAKGGVFAKEGIVLVQGKAPRVVSVRNEKRGGGGEHIYHYDEYAYGERSAGNWLYELYGDATNPTS